MTLSSDIPLVSIIAICYNHSKYLEKALKSLVDQTYSNVEIIIVDDASTDGSQQIINNFSSKHKNIRTILHQDNVGINKSFNEGYKASSGDFIIDFATDDILLPERVKTGVDTLISKGEKFGVTFSNALIINDSGKKTGYHYPVNNQGFSRFPPPDGDIYSEILSKYFICPPTMMYRREVLEDLGGYDENLVYEDFDFWVRSSRNFKYCYTDAVLVKYRMHPEAKSNTQYQLNSGYARSTFEVCKKAFKLNRNEVEKKALNERIMYELRQAIFMGDKDLADDYLKLLEENDVPKWNVRILQAAKELRNFFKRKS